MRPKTVVITPDFVDDAFAAEVVGLVPKKPNIGSDRNQFIRFGSAVPYKKGHVSDTIPSLFDRFRNSITFDSVVINEYYPDQWIAYHIDKIEGGPCIYIISLLSDAEMTFKFAKKPTCEEEKIIHSFSLPKNSLTMIKDDLRINWKHALRAKELRYSVVFRDSRQSHWADKNIKNEDYD